MIYVSGPMALFSQIEVDGNQVSVISDIDMENGPFDLYIGKSGAPFDHLRGMVKKTQVRTGNKKLFDFKPGTNFKNQNITDSANLFGVQYLKKGRFETEFRA